MQKYKTLPSKKVIGDKAEDIASEYLAKKGMRILERNWRFSKAEVDVIAMDGEILVFVEVKSRSYTTFGEPEEMISSYKEKLLGDAANMYMQKINHDWEIRFDIISIVFDKDKNYVLNHYPDAWF